MPNAAGRGRRGWGSYRSVVDVPPGVVAKLDRADKHIIDLGKVVEDFLAPEPFGAERAVSADGREHIVSWTRTAKIPVEISLIAGDVVHNLRSALDHLAVEIERASARTAGHELTAHEERRPQFPVALTTGEFDRQTKRYFKYASSATIDVLRAFQPCSLLTQEPKNSFLYQVSELDNADKHRVLSGTPITPVAVSTGWPKDRSWTWIDGPPLPFAPGVEIGRYIFAKATTGEDAPLELRFGLTLVTDPWVPHDIRYRFSDYAKTITDGVIVPICQIVSP